MDNNVRKRVYDVLLSKTGYKDSFEDFNKFMDTDNGAREKVYGVLRDKTGYKDSLEDFNKFMGGGLKDDAVSPQRRPSLREQVNKPQFPAMEELPWMNNTKDRNDALYYTNESEKRIANSFKKGDFEPFSHKEEDTRVNEQYTAKKVGNESDIIENARNRFALTERGYELDNELSTIQEEKTNRYLEEFKKSKEYQEMAGKQIRTREEADATNKAINDLFAQRYGETINKEMQPYNDAYRNEVFSRYGVGIKDDLTKLGKKNTSNQVADLTQEVNFMLDKHHESLKQHGGSGNNAMNALMGSTQYNQATGEQRRDIGALESAHRLLERSQEIINEAGKKGNTNFVEGLGRGLRDNFDADKWTMGLAEMADAKYLNNALEKSERGEPLTPIEEKLLEASTINMVTQAYFSSDLGRGYKAGQVTAESLPFMLEFIVNPISGSGNVIARKLLSYGMRRFGRSSSKAARMTLNAFGNALKGKNARIAGRLIGNSAAALGMEGTTGVGHVAAGTLDRLNQNYETSFDDNGEVQVDKVGNMGLGEAFARSSASRFFENQSEMIFNAFRGGSKVAKEAVASVAPGMSGKTVNKLVDFYDKIRNNKTFQSVTDRAQFHGILEEYGEEVYNNIANVAIGEMSLEDATDIDSNIDTFLGLAPTSLAFTALGIGGLVHENTKAKNRLRKFVSELDKDSRAIFDELWTEVEKGNNDIAKAFVKKTLGDNSFTPEQKKERVFSVKDMINARDTEQVVNEADGTEEVADVADEAASAPIDKVNVYRDFVRAGRKAKQVLPEEIISQLPSVTDVESFIAEKNLNDVQKEAANAYSNAFGLFSEYQGDVLKRRQEVANTTREQAIDDVERIANQDTGGVVQVKHKFLDNPVYLVGGRLAFGEDGLLDIENSDDRVYYLDEDGNRKMAPAHDFDSVLSDDMKEDVIGMRLQDADQQFIQEEEASLSTPDIPAPERGDRVVINGDTYLIEEQDVDVPGGVLAVKLDANGAIDVNNGRQISLSADEYYSAKEAELWGENKTASETEDVQEKKVLDDGRLIIPLASSENEVAYNVLDRNGNTLDSGSMSLDDFNALKPFVEEREEDLNDDGTLVNPLPADNVLRNEVENDSATLNEESNVPQGEEVLEENTPSIPSDEKGNVLYHRVPAEVTIDAINREELEPDEIDSFVGANKESSAKLVSSLESKPPKMGTSIAKYKADKLAWSDKLSDAKAQVDYWNSVSEEIAASRVQPGDRTAEEIRSMGEPLTGEELAAAMLGTGRLPVLYDSYKKETGGRNAEARGMVGLFVSKANGGMTIEEAGEQLMLADQENGTNFFDPNDPNAGRNAIIDVLSGARTRGDLSGYIQRNREQMAERERQAEYDAYSSWTEDNFGMTPENYEAYEEQAPVSIAERFKDFDEEDFYNNIANELNEEQREVAGVTESSEVLQGEGIVSPERIETSNNEGGTVPVGSESNSENGALLEETPTELNETPIPAYNKEGVEEAIPESEMSTEEEMVQVENGDEVIEAAQETLNNIAEERKKVNQSPTEAQKEAGNYQKGHVKIGRYNISIENSKGSERSGVDSNGQAWSITMNNDYGYIRGTESVDGDHIDIFLSDLPDQGSVFVVDQVKEDGSFDEHKVMYGFSSVDEARDAYLANYSLGWKGLGTITEVSKEDFNKWIDSSKRKTKPFSEYKIARIKSETDFSISHVGSEGVIINEDGTPMTLYHGTLNKNVKSVTDLEPGHRRDDGDKASFNGSGVSFSPDESVALDYSGGRMENVYRGNVVLRKPYYSYGIAGMSESEAVEFTEKLKTDGYDGIIVYASPVMRKHGDTPIEVIVFSKDNIIKIDDVQKEINLEENPVAQNRNTLVSEDRYTELKKRMQEKLRGQMNIGIDPEILAIGTEMAVYHIEKGSRKFADYAKEMIKDLGDAIRPYLKSFYNGVRDLPEMDVLSREMDLYDDVSRFDVANFDKSVKDIVAMSEQIVKESAIDKQVTEVKGKTIAKKSRKTVSSQKESVPVIMQDMFNQNVEENGSERRSEEADSRLGETQREEVEGVQGRRMDRSSAGDIRTNEGRSRRVSNVPATESRRDVEPSEKKNLRNNRNERGKDYAPASVKARFDANIAAIRLMRELTERAGTPKPAEMKILRRYSGWGGLGTFFNNEHTAEGQILRELLGEEEYEAAAMSINSAYYTPASVTDSLWDAAEKLGFKGGTILEGSAGIGSIIGAMPEGINERSVIEAIEIDSISGNILKLLYPDAKVHVQGFQDTNIKNGSVDLAITNVPFVTGLHVYDKIDKDLARKFKNIHDFCIAKNIRKLSEGGIGILITSNGTLDKSRTLREWIIGQGKADVIGAFRLNNETFGGTNATSDIIIVQKRAGNQPSAHAIDVLNTSVVRTGEYETGESRWDKKLGRDVNVTKPVAMEYNSYFVQHPENMAGEMAFAYEKGDTFRPGSVGLYPVKGQNQQKILRQWVEGMPSIVGERNTKASEQTDRRMATAEKEGTLLLNEDGELCVSQRGEAVPVGANKNKVKGYNKSECLGDYNAIKTALDEVLQYQMANEDDSQLKPLLKKLNRAYDSFTGKYGSLNRNTSISFLKNDVDFPSISALEDYRETKDIGGEKSVSVTKTNVFNGRVIGYKAEPTPTTVKDGVIASVYKYGSIDLGYIADKLEKDKEQVKNEILNERIGFVNPTTGGMDVRYEYLSGNVREKMELAKANNAEGEYAVNIEELEKVIPMDIPAHLIEFSLGSSWIDPQLYQQFLSEEFGVDSKVEHVEGAWIMKSHNGKYAEKNRQAGVYSKMFDTTIYGDELVGAALNNRTIGVKRIIKNSDGSTETLTDKDATQACNTRIAEIKDSFKEWARGKMHQDEALAEKMMRVYNDKFNAIVPKSIDDMFLPERFGGAAEFVTLYPHQKKSVIRGTTEPLMLAHEVGTGKTFTLISTAMEMRRIGTAKKPMIVVQNATVGQFVSEAKKLYPNASILTLSERDRTPERRRAFYGKIKYSDWDMIVVPQSTFEMIPDSPERQMTFIRERIDDKMHALEAMKEAGADEQIIKGMEKELDDLEIEFATVSSGESATKKDAKGKAKAADNASVKAREQLDRRTDDVQYFDEMGVDAILVDEAHEYKRLGFATMMTRGVKGIDPAGSKKSAGVYLKTRAVLEQNGWKNVVFATGTPISNTAAELWTFMKYLMPKEVMVANEIYYFDDFVRNFGNISQSLEFATNGKFKENTRFAAYINKPELVRLWASVSDTVLTKEVDYVNDKVPEMESGKAQDIFLPQSDGLIDIMRAVRKRLDEFENMSGKEKRANSSIPLTMYGIAKRAAIDTRLVDKDASDDPNSKTNRVVKETLRSLGETESYKGTVAIFCDNQRRWDGKMIGFDLFDDMKRKLVEKGVSLEQIVIMKSGMSISQKEKIFADVNAGNVRVIIGNTQTLGTGVNIQERLHTLVHMDAPDRPMDYTQRNGRILRQGNLHKPWNKPVRILRFGVEDSLDVTSYQRLKTKAGFIDSIMDSKGALANNQENRTLEEEEEGLFDNPVAVLSGSQYALLKNQAEREYRKYANKKAQYEADQIYITNRLRRNEGKIKANLELIEERREQVVRLEHLFPDGIVHEVKIAGKMCRTDAEIDSALRELVNKPIGEKVEAARKNANYREEKVTVKLSLDGVAVDARVRISRDSVYDNKMKSFRVVMHKDVSYSCEELGLKDVPSSGGYVRNALDDLLENVVSGRDARESMDALIGANAKMMEENGLMKERNGKPFGYEKELKSTWEKVGEYTDLMRKELEEKEAKYADRGSDSVELDVIESESILGEDIETRYGLGEFSLNQERGVSIEKAMGVVSKFETQVKNHPHISLVESEADIEQLKEYGVKDQVIDDLKKNAWGNESVVGVYIDSAKIMVMFPSHAKSEEHLESFMWHENVHYAISNKGLEEKESLLNACLDFVKNKYNDIYENIVNQYADTPDVWAEESVAYLVQEMLEQNGANKLLNAKFAGNEDISNLFTQLFNFINDGTRRKYNQFRRDANKDGGTEKEVQGNDGNGVKIGKSLERSRKEEGATRGEQVRPGNREEVIHFGDTQNEEEPSDGTIEHYEEELKKQTFKAKEAYQDSMLALKKLQEVIEEHSGEKLKSSENAYMAENHMSSKSTREAEMYGENFFKPMLVEVGNLMKDGASHREILDYMMAKHGLERNEIFAMRDAEIQASKKYDKQISELQLEYDKGHLQEDEFKEKSDVLKIEKADFIKKQYLKNRKNDYSGLSSLTGEEDYEAAAKEMVDAFEENFDSTPLWDKVNAATKETLRKSYESGMMSKSTYEKVKNQFKYYIPLRGWNEQTAADVYEYFNSEVSPVNSVLKSAKGRTSVADDPLAVIGNMAESTILQGNRNMMKQRFMNMAINHPSDLLSIGEAWYVIDPSTGEWTISYPRIEESDSADVIAQKVEEHESRMRDMQRDGEATKVSEGLNIDYRINSNQAKEHIVSVKRNGKDYLIYVNGNPRAAQAVNGLTNPDVESDNVLKRVSRLNRQLAANFTTRNPAFVASNLARDLIFSTSAVFVKEGPIYAIRYTANIPKAMKIAMRNISGKKKDELFEEFLSNGGETGYTALHNVDQYKRMIKKELGEITGKTDYFKYVKACAHFFSMMNRWAEDVSRFNAFMTSRELGRTVSQSIHDAKEVTVNFNKKGSGYKTGGVFGLSAGTFRNFYLFFNAAVQSLANFGRLAQKNKTGFGIMIGGFTTAGFIVPVLNALAISLLGDDGDDDYYNNLSEWERRNNLCIYIGGGAFLKIPLPIELRAFYGLGEMAYQETIGNGSNGKDIAYKAINQMTELLPINPLGNNGDLATTLMPDVFKPFLQIVRNEDFMGKPIYRDNSFNKTMPEWTKAYRGTSKWLVDMSEWMNLITGGDKYKKGGADKIELFYVNINNPAQVEHLFESYFGGMATTINQTGKTLSAGIKSVIDGKVSDDYILRNMPVINRFASDAKDDRTSFGKINTRYFELYNQYEETKKNLNGYIKEASKGDIDYLNKLSELQNSKEYDAYKVFDRYQKQINKIKKAEKKFADDSKNKTLQGEIAKLKKELIERIEGI